jgi:isocitrate dehydrogenase
MNIKADAGESTYNLAKRAIQYAIERNMAVSMTHNDDTVSVYPESHIHDILEKLHYMREYKRLLK